MRKPALPTTLLTPCSAASSAARNQPIAPREVERMGSLVPELALSPVKICQAAVKSTGII